MSVLTQLAAAYTNDNQIDSLTPQELQSLDAAYPLPTAKL
jgi:hypothetical protein